jgi:hypothetical protein
MRMHCAMQEVVELKHFARLAEATGVMSPQIARNPPTEHLCGERDERGRVKRERKV